MKRWSDEAWEAALPVYRKILGHPFVRELADGTLPAEQFRHYIRQDALYLDGYARRLAHVASRLTRREHTEAFLHFALDGIAVERALHAQFLAGDAPTRDEMSPACLLYTALLDAQATAPVEVEAAALLPCFVVYQRVGEAIFARANGSVGQGSAAPAAGTNGGTPLPDGRAAAGATPDNGAIPDNGAKHSVPLHENPFRAWIETYADPAFAASAELAARICDELAAGAGGETRRRMTDIFMRCTRMEWMFWESARNLENWKIGTI